MKRTYDLVVMGASGFTGKLVAEYLLNQYGVGKSLSWAIAGRSREKLEQVRDELGNPDLPILTADSHDRQALDTLTRQTRVVCSTVGPFALHGSELVASCVENGTDYCDITGEVQWIRRMIDKHHEAAVAKGVKIVPTCGFDSIPSDMGVFFLQKEAIERFGHYCTTIKFGLRGASGGISGGTYSSLNNVLQEAEQDKSLYAMLFDPYGLNPQGKREGPDGRDLMGVKYDPDFRSYLAPFIMAFINTRVVRRANALMDFRYGKEFRYEEALLTGPGPKGWLRAYVSLLATGLMTKARPGSFAKRIADWYLPKPGEGPSEAQRKAGFFNIRFVGKLSDGRLLQAKVKGNRDSGYGSTCRMLGESAVCLALDREKLPQMAGLLTPSVAMGDTLLERLQTNAGLTFKLDA